MKVTALIPDEMVTEVKKLTNGKNITDSLLIALNDWISQQKIRRLTKHIAKKPLSFKKGFSAIKIRSLNRQLT
jgi:hypothetical protein